MKIGREIFLCGNCSWFRKFPPDEKNVPGYGICESPTRLNNPGGGNDWVYYMFPCFIERAVFEPRGDTPNIGD